MALGSHSGSYHHGDHAVICDICGFRYRRSDCKFNWKHQLVCYNCFEIRNPQDYAVHPKGDRQAVPEPRPRQTPVYIDIEDAPAPDGNYPALCGFGSNTHQSS